MISFFEIKSSYRQKSEQKVFLVNLLRLPKKSRQRKEKLWKNRGEESLRCCSNETGKNNCISII